MLYIKSFFGNIFVLVLENFELKGNCQGGTFVLDETQIDLCIKNYIIIKKFCYTLSEIWQFKPIKTYVSLFDLICVLFEYKKKRKKNCP